MNERIKELAIECQPPYGNFNHQKFAELIIKNVIDILNDEKNYNRCTFTTYDLDKNKCVTTELKKKINETFGTKL